MGAILIPNTMPMMAFDGSTLIAPQGIVQIGEVPLTKLDDGGATTGQVLRWNGSAWTPQTHPRSLTVDVTMSGTSGSQVVTGQTWVAASSVLVATVTDHPSGESASSAAGHRPVVTIGNLSAGVGFTVYVHASGSGTGPYRINIMAV